MSDLDRRDLRAGDRVRHRNGWWGTILEAVPQGDGSTEYRVQRDKPLLPGMKNDPTWWASYHLNEWERHPRVGAGS